MNAITKAKESQLKLTREPWASLAGFVFFLALLASLKYQWPWHYWYQSQEPFPTIVAAEQGWGQLAFNRTSDNKSLTINGRRYPGLGTHADSTVTIKLPQGAIGIKGFCGYPDHFTQGKIVCSIRSLGTELYTSPELNKARRRVPFQVQVLDGSDTVELRITSAQESLREAHGAWLLLQPVNAP